ncbi:MAG: chromosomal replication initiator protein DnaA [Chitinophagales bacterium]|jgi:chromosomal replication initiator protein|nr:chromosomal replication initiator protein DnaA [Chitinophagales bacterium]
MSQKDYKEVWNNCLKIIKDNISLQSYKTWFEPIVPVQLEKNVLTIQVPSQFFYEWLEEHYVTLLRKTILREIGKEARLEYRIVMEQNGSKATATVNYPNQNAGTNKGQDVNAMAVIGGSVKNPFIIPGLKKINVDPKLNPIYTFDTFIEGDCNRLARSAGFAVAQKPGGTSFNPLVIYSPLGLGKTHLAHAIGNQIKQLYPQKTVLYVQIEMFANQFIDAMKNGHINDFIHFYQMMDVLIIDDIHFLSGKPRMQEIFFTIFNHLHQNAKQLVLTSDRPIKDLQDMDERLLSRFKWGLIADMQAPDFETRIAIFESKMYAAGIELPRDVVEFVAYNINSTVRDLEGALHALTAQAVLNKKEVDLELAKKIVKNLVKSVSREVSIEFIQKTVCDYYSIPFEKLREKTRKRHIVQARQLSMFLAKNFTKNSLKAIGKHFGGRDHSTVIHSCQAVQNMIDTDTQFKDDVLELEKKISMSL